MEINKENLHHLINNLLNSQGKVIEIVDKNNPDYPLYRIRYMNTAGGMKLCLKETDYRGEGSGIYFDVPQTEDLIDLTLRLFNQKAANRKEFYEKLKHRFEKYRPVVTDDTFELNIRKE